MSFYRGDTRDDVEVMEPRGLYEDGGCRPADCKTEVAFSDSIGGAIYGAAQYRAHGEEVDPKDFIDMDTKMVVHVYEAPEDANPDYNPCPSSVHDVLDVATDFDLTGEVRFCDREVPVKKVCSCEITGHDLAVMASILYLDNPVNYFDFDKEVSEGCRGSPDEWTEDPEKCMHELDTITNRIMKADRDFIKNLLLMTPTPISQVYGSFQVVEGIDERVALAMMQEFEKRCR